MNTLRDFLPKSWKLKTTRTDLATLTEWAVEARYPSVRPEATEADALQAIDRASAVLTSVVALLAEHGFQDEKI